VSPSIFHTLNIVQSNPFIISATPSSSAPTSDPSVFAQGIFQKYRLSEIAIADIDEKQFGYIVSDLDNATKSELASTILTYLSYYINRDLYDEELFWEFKQDFDE
ncbi:hypothetical protein GcC1_103030, partial [Golovinomyces cichoracearum]